MANTPTGERLIAAQVTMTSEQFASATGIIVAVARVIGDDEAERDRWVYKVKLDETTHGINFWWAERQDFKISMRAADA